MTYKLRYLPLFYEDLQEKMLYIARQLQNSQAANDLLDAVEKAILERLSSPEAFCRFSPPGNESIPTTGFM